MPDETPFAPDANVFIEASRRYYAFDIAANFWDGIIQHVMADRILIVDVIKKEIEKGKDELKDWSETNLNKVVSSEVAETIKSYSEILAWVQAQDQFFDYAKSEFAAVADGWLIAHAKANSLIVVTHETFQRDVKKRVPIPNVCQAFDISYCNTFEMMRSLDLKLHGLNITDGLEPVGS